MKLTIRRERQSWVIRDHGKFRAAIGDWSRAIQWANRLARNWPYDNGGFVGGPIAVRNDTGRPELILRHDRPTYGKPRKDNDQ